MESTDLGGRTSHTPCNLDRAHRSSRSAAAVMRDNPQPPSRLLTLCLVLAEHRRRKSFSVGNGWFFLPRQDFSCEGGQLRAGLFGHETTPGLKQHLVVYQKPLYACSKVGILLTSTSRSACQAS